MKNSLKRGHAFPKEVFDIGPLERLNLAEPKQRDALINLVERALSRAPNELMESQNFFNAGNVTSVAGVLHGLCGSPGTIGGRALRKNVQILSMSSVKSNLRRQTFSTVQFDKNCLLFKPLLKTGFLRSAPNPAIRAGQSEYSVIP